MGVARRLIVALLVVWLALPLHSDAANKHSKNRRASNRCAKSLEPRTYPAALMAIQSLKIATYNLETIKGRTGKMVPTAPDRYAFVAPPVAKSEDAIKGLAVSMNTIDADVMVWQEVESLEVAEWFQREYLGDRYNIYSVSGNDPRGIRIAFVVKKKLPLSCHIESNRKETWIDPTRSDGRPRLLFTRDLPVLSVYAKGFSVRGPPLLSVLGVHHKSKRDRPNDPESAILRRAQVNRSAMIWRRLLARWGKNARLIMAGDFNGEIHKEDGFGAITSLKAHDSFQALSRNTGVEFAEKDLVTHSWHPVELPTKYSQFDYIFFSQSLHNLVRNSYVFRYFDEETGEPKPLPQTKEERSRNPSDHFPVVAEIEFPPVVAANIEELTENIATRRRR